MSDETTETSILAWSEDEAGIWTAADTAYAVIEDTVDGVWVAQDGDRLIARAEPTQEAAQAVCQQHHDRRLTWRSLPCDVWVATCPALPGEDYCVSPSDEEDDRWIAAYLDQPIGEPAPNMFAAQAACQEHAWRDIGSPAATEPPPEPEPPKLKWRKVRGEDAWQAPGYDIGKDDLGDEVVFEAWHMDPKPPVKLGSFEVGEDETEKTVLKEAKAECERHAAGDGSPPPVDSLSDTDMCELLGHDWDGGECGRCEAARGQAPDATGKPRQELVRRSILVDLTPEEKDTAGRRLALADDAIDGAEADLATEAERHKAEKKRLEGIIEAKKDEARELRGPARDGTERRELEVHEQLAPDDGTGAARDVIYLCPVTGKELDRRPATRAELQKWLPGYEPDETPPEPPPEPKGVKGEHYLPWDDDGKLHVDVDDGNDERPDPLPADQPLTWEHVNVETEEGKQRQHVAGDRDGEHYRLAKDNGGLWQITYTSADGGVRLLAGRHKRLKDARAMAEADNQARIRWGAIGEGIILSKCGAYQLTESLTLGRWADGALGRWSAIYVGGLGGDGIMLTEEPLELPAAQAACQAHADKRRAELEKRAIEGNTGRMLDDGDDT